VRIKFANGGCSLAIQYFPGATNPAPSGGCLFVDPDTYPYSVEGFGGGSGVVIVKGLQISATSASVVYGQRVGLTGLGSTGFNCGPPTFAPPRKGTGTIHAQRFGEAAWHPLATVETQGFNADWSYEDRPTIQTRYLFNGGALWTEPLTINVRPRLTLTPRGGVS
jgi:hypothetical protein